MILADGGTQAQGVTESIPFLVVRRERLEYPNTAQSLE